MSYFSFSCYFICRRKFYFCYGVLLWIRTLCVAYYGVAWPPLFVASLMLLHRSRIAQGTQEPRNPGPHNLSLGHNTTLVSQPLKV